jgi:type II secretory pathway pseudopilin PulG
MQQGAALMVFVVLLSLGGAFFLVRSLNKASTTYAAERDQKTQQALQTAKAALLGYIASTAANTGNTTPGQFPCPEDTTKIGLTTEGEALTACTSATLPQIGRLPWKTLNLGDIRDGWGEKLWYVLSPGFRVAPINSTTPYQLTASNTITTLDGSPVIALIISPGPAINGQSRPAPTSSSAPSHPNYLEGENATSPADRTFTSTGSINQFNDRVIAITANEAFDIIEPIVAQRIGNSVDANSLAYSLTSGANSYFAEWGTYPFAATFANPATAASTAFRGATGTYQGLVPASSPGNDPGYITWPSTLSLGSSFAVATQPGSVGSIRTGSTSCTRSGTSPRYTMTCIITFRWNNTTNTPNTPLVNISLTLNNVGKTFISRFDTTTQFGYAYNSTYSPSSPATPSAPAQSLDASGNLILTWTNLQFPRYIGASSTSNRRLTITISPPVDSAVQGILAGHSILNNWFFTNEWYRAAYYAVAPEFSPAHTPSSSCGTCITVSSVTGKKVVMILTGRAMSGQSQPSSSVADYLEGTNRTAATTSTLAFSKTSRISTANDITIEVVP